MKTKLLCLLGLLCLSFNLLYSQDFSPSSTEATTVDCSCVGANTLITNPSFETNTTGWTPYNGTFVSGAYAAQCGTNSGQFNHGDAAGRGGFYQDVNITAGSAFSLKFFGGVHDAGPNASFNIIYYNGAAIISSVVVAADINTILPSMSLYSLNSTAPAGTTKMRLEGSTAGESGADADGDWLKVDGFCLTITPVCNAAISSLRFYDTASSSTVSITNNGTYELSTLPASFGIEALVTGTAESVTFAVTGSATGSNTENTPAYTHPGTGTAWPYGTGTFTVVAKVYTVDNAGGQLCDTETFTFTITDNSCTCPGNLISNSSFETNLNGWFAVNGSLSSSTTYKACGSKGIVLDHTSGTAKILTELSISATMPVGAQITFSAYAGTHAAGQNCAPSLIIEYYKAGATTPFATATPTPITRNVDVAPIDVLAQFTVSGTIPPETAFIRVGGSINCDYIKFDAACLKVDCIPVTAGTDGNYDVCDNALTQINLFDYIIGEQTGGVWTLNGQTVSNLLTPATGNSTNIYTYTVTGTAPCGNDESKVTVNVYQGISNLNAGPDADVCAGVAGEELEDGSTGLTTVKKYTLNGTVTGATSTLWTAYLPGDMTMAPVGSFDDPTKLNAIFTPPIGKPSIVLRLTTNDPQGPCSASFDELILTEIACAGILDPCSCNAVTYSPNEVMEVKDFIEVDGTPGQIWSLVANGGGSNPLNGGAPYGTMQGLDPNQLTTTNVDIPLGTTLTEVSPGLYRLDFAHDSGVGYTATVRNITAGPTGGQELSVHNYCIITTFTPDINISGTICDNAGPRNLNSVILDPNPPVVGVVTYTYTVNGGPETPISTTFDPMGLAGATIKIYAKYTPEAGNIIDCVILRDATGNIAVTPCALPVNLINFDGKVVGDQVMLNWKISEEKNFSHFEVEHTTSGTEFGSIGKVFANGKNYFNYADNAPEKGDNYYRLKMVDLDGSFNYSKIVNINFEKNKNFVNVENPSVDGSFTISTNFKNPSFSLLTSNGSKIETTTISNGSRFIVKPANAPAGLYFLNIVSEGKVVTKKVIVR